MPLRRCGYECPPFLQLKISVRILSTHADMPLDPDAAARYIEKYLVYAILWSFAGDANQSLRCELGDYIRSITAIALPPAGEYAVIDYEPTLPNGDWGLWSRKVQVVEVETHQVRQVDHFAFGCILLRCLSFSVS